METFIDIMRNGLLMMVGITIVAGVIFLTSHALISNTVEDQPEDH